MNTQMQIIAAVLSIFFLATAVITNAIAKAKRRRIANAKSAKANGGTEDSPVQLYDPFASDQPTSQEPTENPKAQVNQPAVQEQPEPPKATDVYKWN